MTDVPKDVTEQRLIDAVLASPDAVGPREVYGDWLLERGDVRGELIALQSKKAPLTDAERERVDAIIAAHGMKWVGPLAPVLDPKRLRFERGFLDACVASITSEHEALVGDPHWSTVREIDTQTMDLVVHPCMLSLRRATITPAALSKLAKRAEPVPLEAAMGVRKLVHGDMSDGIDTRNARSWSATLDVGALVNLRALALDTRCVTHPNVRIASFDWLLASKLGQKLVELTLSTEHPEVVAWYPIVERLPNLRTLRLRVNSGFEVLVVERGHVTLQTTGYVVGFPTPRRQEWIDRALAKLPKTWRLTLEHVGSGALHARSWREVFDQARPWFESVEVR